MPRRRGPVPRCAITKAIISQSKLASIVLGVSPMTRTLSRVSLSLIVAGLAFGCSSWLEPPDEDLPVVDGDGADSFISHVAGQSDDGFAGADAGVAAPGDEEAADRVSPERAIAEADIIQVDGDRLYALSGYAGLTVIDIADPSNLQVLGTYRTSATPFEMYLRNGVAYVMFNGFYRWVLDEASGEGSYQQTARMVALDVGDPAAISILGDHDIPGEVSDSRMVGDVVYLVTFENGWCWRCDRTPSTRIASFDVSNPSAFVAIDALAFDGNEGSWGRRSISVTTERMYVAGPSWAGDGSGTIQIVDIANPNGELALGATVDVAGSIDNRWQMDEHDGVLRVISQAGGWNSLVPPVVETFRVTSTDEITPLASMTMTLPRPENLRSVRFDGPRAYAITFEQIDPFFTIDLSDPAAPVQMGELEIPGWVYHMEPRGDRVYGLGFSDAASDRGMTVSVFDVSDMANPVMLDRVAFGGSWAWAVEDQDRIHKAFNLLLDRGLILVPFAGSSSDPENCEWRGQSGIQIIEVTGDDLRLRGVAPQIGTARRSILRGDTLFGVSDHAVQSFDIRDRDAPAALDQLELARNVSSVHVLGDRVLRFSNDWWSNRTVLDITDPAHVEDAEGQGELDLSAVLENERTCNSNHSWGSSVYVHGDYAYVPRYAHRWSHGSGSSTNETQITFYVVDLRDRTAPRIISSFSADPVHASYGSSGSTYEQYADIVMTDGALLIGRRSGTYSYDYYGTGGRSETQYRYDIFDLGDPAAPRFTTRFDMPSDIAGGGWGYGPRGCGVDLAWGWWYPGWGSTSALVSGDVVASNHAVPLDDDTGRVRYYLDRLDVSDPAAPRLLPAVNVPGQLAHFDAARGLAITVEDDLRIVDAGDHADCAGRGSRVLFDPTSGRCRVWDRHLNSLRVEGNRAIRLSRANLDAGGKLSQRIAVSDERVFVGRSEPLRWSRESPDTAARELSVFAFASNGQLQTLPTVALDETRSWYWSPQLVARGSRAFLSETNALSIIDTRNKLEPVVTEHEMPGWYCSSLQVDAEHAYCALGAYGVERFDL